MNKRDLSTLVLGSTGKTGSRVAADLINRGLKIRTAARSGADVTFDWNQRDSYGPALDGIGRVYLVAPVMRIDFADDVSAFLDAAEAAGVQHVTFLSAYGMEHAPDKVATRRVELDLLHRRKLGHTILRPAWFMQNFSETFLKPIDGAIVVPTGDGAEAFITVAEAAAIISDEAGRTITHVDLDRQAWIAGAIANGVPPEYGAVLSQLTETVASGHGSRPNGIVETITGRPPHTFRNFAHHNANAWKEVK